MHNKTGLQPISRPVERVYYLGVEWGFKVPLMQVFSTYSSQVPITENWHDELEQEILTEKQKHENHRMISYLTSSF